MPLYCAALVTRFYRRGLLYDPQIPGSTRMPTKSSVSALNFNRVTFSFLFKVRCNGGNRF
ncbi:hypothetical protein IH992_24125 [Candidatus Poribacteria bacterium]|nr:hypothetical protein [Candidatus Poribacteria bacterium]